MIRWKENPEMERFLIEFIPGHSVQEIQSAFNEKFGIMLTVPTIKGFKSKKGIKSGTVGGQFQKGHVAPNKGKKVSPEVYEKMKGTMFKKGNVPHNIVKVGTERNLIGYIEVKVAEPNVWKLKHRVMYEKYHNVKLSRNDVIIFLDHDRFNFDESNLYRLTRAELIRYNSDGLYSDDPEVTLSAALIAKIKVKVFESKR